MSYQGWIRVKVYYHGLHCEVIREETWFHNPKHDKSTNADFFDQVKEFINPTRKNGRVKSVSMSVETWQLNPSYQSSSTLYGPNMTWWPDFYLHWRRPGFKW